MKLSNSITNHSRVTPKQRALQSLLTGNGADFVSLPWKDIKTVTNGFEKGLWSYALSGGTCIIVRYDNDVQFFFKLAQATLPRFPDKAIAYRVSDGHVAFQVS